MAKPSIDTISFDLDNTLCRYEQTPNEVLEESFAIAGVDPIFTVEEYVDIFDEIADLSEDMQSLRRRSFRQLAQAAGYEETLGEAVAEVYNRTRDPPGVIWRDGMKTVFERFSREYDIVVVTNGLPDAQLAKREQLDLLQEVEEIIYGGGSYPRKPDPIPFYAAIDAVESSPDRTVHIGDSLEHDVAGANRAGIASIWFPHPEWQFDGTETTTIEADYVVATAEEFELPPWEEAHS